MGRAHHRRRLSGDTRRQANDFTKHSNSNQQKKKTIIPFTL